MRRCLAFDPSDEQLQQADVGGLKNLLLLAREEEERMEALIVAIMHDFAACVLMALESWVLHVDPASAVILTPLDNPAAPTNEDVSGGGECACVCVCVCVRACVRACVRVCVCVCMRARA